MIGFISKVFRKAGFQWQRAQLERELDEELAFHTAMKEREVGSSAAARAMGNMTLAREESRDAWTFLFFERLRQDARYAFRVFRKSPGFTLVAALSLALGIGGTAAMFSLVNALLIRPLPYPEPDRLVSFAGGAYPRAGTVMFQQKSRTMDVASISSYSELNLTGQGPAVRLFGAETSANFFTVLGAAPERGRTFTAGEDRAGRDRIVLISHSLWISKFAGDPGIVGRVVRLDDLDREVIGVMPPGFALPASRVDVWVPSRIDPSKFNDYWGSIYARFIARLRPGVTPAQADGEMRALNAELRTQFPFPMRADYNRDVRIAPLQDDLMGDVRKKLLLLFSSVGIVLLIACTNVASLLLARAASRRKELALRAGLGAGRMRIVRQLLTESVLLSAAGGALGILLGAAALSIFRSTLPADTQGIARIAIDWQVVAFAAAVAFATGIVFGIAPALSASRIDLANAIKTGTQRSSGAASSRLRTWLIGAEVALAVILVAGAGLLIQSLYTLTQANTGFRPERLMTLRISPNPSACAKRATCIALYSDLLRRARDVSGVSGAALVNAVPLTGELPVLPLYVEGYPSATTPSHMLWFGAITAGYFDLMHIALIAGHGFTDSDGADTEPVLVISSVTAKRFWPGQNALGKHMRLPWDQRWRRIVGIAADVRQFNLEGRRPAWIEGEMYFPYPQAADLQNRIPAEMHMVFKAASESPVTANAMRQLAMSLNPDVPVGKVETLAAIVDSSISDFRSTIGVFISFAAAALLLAAVGIYGLVSYSVAQRTYEIGVRVAIGASKPGIAAMILRQGLQVGAVGVALGIVGGLLFTRFLQSLLYGVAATDPVTFIGVSLLLLLVCAAASGLPAWRAAQVDPVRSLRAE